MKRIDQITLKQLRTLRTISEAGTIVNAADILGLTGPAVHSQLKTLEDLIGAPLILRDGKSRNELTPQGKVLVAAYDEVRAALRRAISSLNAVDAGYKGSVTLGVVSTGKYFAPSIVAHLNAEMPELSVSLKIGNREETIAGLARGEFDICIMGRPPREPLVDSWPLADHPHVLIANAGHPLAARDSIAPEELFGERFVLREAGSGTRILSWRFLDDIGKGRVFETIEMSSNETIKQAVISGLGLAVISAHTVAYELETGRLVALRMPGLPIIRKWYVVQSPGVVQTPAAKRVQEWLLANPDRFLPTFDTTPASGN